MSHCNILAKQTYFFEVEIEPVAKERARVVQIGGNTRSYTPPKTANYEKALCMLVRAKWPHGVLSGALSVAVVFTLPRPKSVKRMWPIARPDLSNYLKSFEDALNEVVWGDDSQIVNLQATKEYVKLGQKPKVTAFIWRIQLEQDAA